MCCIIRRRVGLDSSADEYVCGSLHYASPHWSVNEPRGHTHHPESMSPPLESARRVTLDFLTHQSSPGDLIDVSVNS